MVGDHQAAAVGRDSQPGGERPLNVRLQRGALLPGRCAVDLQHAVGEPVVVECDGRSIRGAPSVRSPRVDVDIVVHASGDVKMPTVGRERNSGVGVGNANHLCLHGPSARDIEDEHILIGAVEVRCFEVAVGVITAGQYQHRASIRAHGETYRTISREVRVIPQSRAQGHERRARRGGRREQLACWQQRGARASAWQLHAPAGGQAQQACPGQQCGCRDRDSDNHRCGSLRLRTWHPRPPDAEMKRVSRS